MEMAHVKSINSLRRGLEVWMLLSDHGVQSLNALYHSSGIPKPTLLRILRTLIEAGRVRRRDSDGAYMVSGHVRSTPERPAVPGKLETLLPAALQHLSLVLPWPSDVGVCTGTHMRVIDSNRQAYGARWRHSVIGAEVDLIDSALGRGYLAFTCESVRTELINSALRGSGTRARRREALHQELQLTLARGYGTRDGRYAGPDSHHEHFFSSIAVPVLVSGQAVASISCVWNAEESTREVVIDRCLAHLVRQSTFLGLMLGGEEPRELSMT